MGLSEIVGRRRSAGDRTCPVCRQPISPADEGSAPNAEHFLDYFDVRAPIECPNCRRLSHLSCTTSSKGVQPGQFASTCAACKTRIVVLDLDPQDDGELRLLYLA